MKKVRIKKLTLENWRAQNRTIDFSDRTILRGANGAGKSTVADAFFWLLTGFDSMNRANYDLYDNTKEFTYENALPAIVEAEIDIDNISYTFKRSAKQKWTRQRGEAEYVKDKSDEYLYYIDDLAVSAKVYKDRVKELFADIDKLKLMLNIRYYQMLDWRALRKHFADMVGIISDSELKGDYTSIAGLLEKYKTTDAAKEKLRQEISPLKNKFESLEFEIKGAESVLPDLGGVDEAEKEIKVKSARITEIDKEIMGLGEANKPFVDKREKELAAIREKKQEIANAKKEWDYDQLAPCKVIQSQIDDIDSRNRRIQEANTQLKLQVNSIKQQIDVAEQQYNFLDEEVIRLRQENAEIKSRVFDEHQVCQSCGQPLPYDRISELKESFYSKREKDHNACVEKGVRTKNNRDQQREVIDTLKKALADMPKKEELLDKTSLLAGLEDAKADIIPFEDSDICKILTNQLNLMESQLTVVPEVNAEDLVAEKKRLATEIAELSQLVLKKDVRKDGEKTIADKKQEKTKHGIKLAQLEGLLSKCIEREREWASIVRDRANKWLRYCSVEMLALSKAGKIDDICSVTIDGVDVSVANTARQLVAGIDIAKAFQINAGLNMPLFIDNAEQICDCNIPAVDNQLVLTYVDDKYPTLAIL